MMTRDEALVAFRHFCESVHWRTASSEAMQKYPHQYIVKKNVDSDHFMQAVKIIRSFGVPEKFYRRVFIYLTVGDWKYWTMNDPLDKTVIINRAHKDKSYGTQDAPEASSITTPSVYDILAPTYDARYSTPEHSAENRQIAEMLGDLRNTRVLDIGCGTGLLIDIMPINPRRYLGVEPSQGMVNEFLRKHPEYPIRARSLGQLRDGQFDLAIALFGVASYLSEKELQSVPSLSERWFLMFYADGYAPDYYGKDGAAWAEGHKDRFSTALELGPTKVTEFANYKILEGRRELERN